ncbi:MAG TPA: Hpt domain-containing protein, partial [Gemmataceae bacterium]|nr:Hpt domain-containing protein [Gemmataceae bacterium]
MTPAPESQLLEYTPDDVRMAVDPELLEVFRQEAEGHLQAIRSNLPALCQGGSEVVQIVRRAAHTLKGSAAMVGFKALTRLAHRMEDLLDRIHDGLVVSPEMIDLLNASADRLDDLAGGKEDAAILNALYARYAVLLGADDAAPSPQQRRDAEDRSARPESESSASRSAREAFVRTPLHRLDALMRLVSELTVVRTALEQRLTGDQAMGQLDDETEDLLTYQARVVSELHDRLMHIRLVPFGTLAARLRRTVRQVAELSGKPVELTLEGEAVEVDKAALEDMAEPLMHLLRNAV